MGQLEEDRRQLEEYQTLAKAVAQFERRYRVYAGTRSRREAALYAPHRLSSTTPAAPATRRRRCWRRRSWPRRAPRRLTRRPSWR